MNKHLLQFINKNFSEPASALDLGCGRGGDVAYLKELGWEAVGVDLPEIDLNLPFRADRDFDLVYSIAVLQYIIQRQIFIETCFNNLKPGGRLFILTFYKDDTNFKTTLFTAEELKDLLKDKFKDIEVERLTTNDNHQPIGEHQHIILVATAVKA